MPISKENIIDEFYQQESKKNQYEHKHNSKFCDTIDNLFTDLYKLMKNVKKFRLEHSDVRKQWSSKVRAYVTTNYFQMKLISITEYIQFQNDLDSTLSMIHSLLQQIKNDKHSKTGSQDKSITDLISKIDFLSGLIQKCQKIISSEKTRNDIEDQSKTKSIQHLSQILKNLERNKTHLKKFQQTLNKDEQIKMNNNDLMTENQKQQQEHKTLNAINQQILKNIFNTMSSLKTPKQTTNLSFNSSYYKYQIQNLQLYKNLKQNVEFMLKQTENRNENQESVQETKNHYDFMVNKIADSLKKIEELEDYKYKCTISSSQFTTYFGQNLGDLLTVKQNLQKEWTQKINQQEVSAILRSTQEVNQNLQKTLVKYQGYKNGQKTTVQVPLKDLHEINDKNISIKQNYMKVLTILKHQQKQLHRNKENVVESGQKQHQKEDQNNTHKQNTSIVPFVYTEQQMEQMIKQRLNEQTIKMQNTHKKKIKRIKNEFETKINQLQFQLIQKDSKIMQMTQKQQSEQNGFKLQKKQSIKQAQIDKYHLQRQEEMKNTLLKEVDEKRNDKNKLIEEVNELNEKITELNQKIKQLQSQEAILAVSIDQKATQLQNLQQQIKEFTKSQNNRMQSRSIYYNQMKIKVENQQKNNQINFESYQLNLKLQFQKGKNQVNQKQILSLKQQTKQLTDQKIALKLAIQKITLQTQNLLKEKNTIIQNIKKEINLMQAEKIDFENKIKELKDIKNQYQTTIKAFNQQTVQQKHKIETQGKQIEGLQKQKKQLQNHVVTLQKVQKQKIKLDTEIQHLNNKIQQLNNEIKKLQQENQKNDLQTKNLIQSRMVETKNHQIQILSMEKQLLGLKNKHQNQSRNLTIRYQKQIQNLNKDLLDKENIYKALSKNIVCLKEKIQKLNQQLLISKQNETKKSQQLSALKNLTQQRSIQLNKTFKQERQKFQVQMKEKNTIINDLQVDLADAQKEIAKLKERVNRNSIGDSQMFVINN